MSHFLVFIRYVFLLGIAQIMQAQSTNTVVEKPDNPIEKYKIKADIKMQMYATYTIGQHKYDDVKKEYYRLQNRANFQIRRSQYILSGQPLDNLKFKIAVALDFVGRDILSATQGGTNENVSPRFALWNAIVEWKIRSSNESANLSFGFMPPIISRASLVNGFYTSSFEKSWSQNYIRRHLVGVGPGRAMGVNLGGLFVKKARFLNYGYDLGVFIPQQFTSPASALTDVNPLMAGRISLFLGDPESEKYTTGRNIHFSGKRKGLSLGINGSYQGKTSMFSQNTSIGIDGVLNYHKLSLDGEWLVLGRKEDRISSILSSTSATSGFIRFTYYNPMQASKALEMALMYTFYKGALTGDLQNQASLLGSLSGKDDIIDFTIGYHFNSKVKVTLNYTKNDGDLGEATVGAPINNHFVQSGIPITRGDMVGMGVVLNM